MPKHVVLFREWEAGDWIEVFVDGKEFHPCSNHRLSTYDFTAILKMVGVEVVEETVPDDEDSDA